ncbi:sensor histidine kinase [Dyadobacter alkalitolerans]|uniref:sensor histidine kinase n=1 Tax=Dyadobacter alkalitolerans TaxID=492736 RepID=UPI001E62F11B|nr:HAMP domain-containing sensor histidine kinase [Dyadobacter alkalitolerans]
MAITDSAFYKTLLDAQPFSRASLDGYLTEGLPSPHFNHVTPDYYIIPFGFDRYYVYDKKKVTYYSAKKSVSALDLTGKGFWGFFRLDSDLYYLDEQSLLKFQIKSGHLSQAKLGLTGDISSHPLYGSQGRYKVYWNNVTNQAFILLGSNLYLLTRQQNGDLKSRLVLEGFDFMVNSIVTVYYDLQTDKLFLGSQLKGLFVIQKKLFKVLTTNAKGTDNNFYAQVPYSDSTILSSQGVEFGLLSSSKKVYTRQMQQITKYVDLDKYSVLIDSQGNIWAKNTRTLFKFDHQGKRLLAKWLLPSGVSQLCQGSDGTIWIGTMTLGLYYINPQEASPAPKPYLNNGPDNISWIQQQDRDTLWLASGQGLYKLAIGSKKVISIKGLEDIYVRSLYIPDGIGEVWVTTYKDGLFLLKNGKLTHFPLDKKKYLASAHCIIEDKQGFFWVPCNKGLFQIQKKDLVHYAQKPFDIYYYHHTKEAGFNTNEFNGGCQPCAVQLPNGYVSLPSINGLVWFKPQEIKPELPTGNVYIEGVKANDTIQKITSNTLALDADASDINLKVNIAYLGSPDNLRLSYRLTKNGKPVTGWRPINPGDPDISLPHLESGEYRLSIRKVNGFGARNYSYKQLNIFVAKHWYQTWWAGVSAFLVLVGLFYLALRTRTARIEKQKLALETRVSERTRDLQAALNALSSSEKQLEQQLRLHVHMIASISHDIRTPVKYLGMALQFIQSRIEKSETVQAVNAIQTMTQTISELDQHINNIVTFIKPQVHRHYKDFQTVNLLELVNSRAAIFKDILKTNDRSIQVQVPAGQAVITNPELLGVILHNLIDNAIKAWPTGVIRIHTLSQGKELHLIVADQGPGLPQALLNWLNLRDEKDSHALPEQYNGLGFPMVKEIAKLLWLRVYAENSSGTHIHLIFPAAS